MSQDIGFKVLLRFVLQISHKIEIMVRCLAVLSVIVEASGED